MNKKESLECYRDGRRILRGETAEVNLLCNGLALWVDFPGNDNSPCPRALSDILTIGSKVVHKAGHGRSQAVCGRSIDDPSKY